MKRYSKKDLKVGQILGINVNSTSASSVLMSVEQFISDNVKFYIVTPNPELVLMAQKIPNLKLALNSADIAVADGVGLKIANPSLNIIKGRELFVDLIKLANKNNWKVFLLGGLNDEAELTAKKLRIYNLQCKIEYNEGPKLNNNAEPKTKEDKKIEDDSIEQINKFKPDLLFVAFGNPKQEIWIHKNLSRLNIGGAMAVGGTFRYIAGTSKLPPKWMARCGLEWLYRVITEPKRIGRIFRAVVVFPIRLLLSKLSL
jgi:N-acetylglucosaminyldiphosphoundecaprenol N-acetyl-beta-D-mannosaminyltransferase